MQGLELNIGLVVVSLVLASHAGDTPDGQKTDPIKGDPHAPCYNCEIYNMMHKDSGFQDRLLDEATTFTSGDELQTRMLMSPPCEQVLKQRRDKRTRNLEHLLEICINSQCQYPCKCSNAELRCKAGVNVVKDGCDCCYMCARQQGDLCDYKDKCDEEKGFYCDFMLDGGVRGICRARDAKPCQVEDQTYKDGEEFKPDCRRLCTCQNGQYACTSLCPQEDRAPSTFHCKHPRLIEISGECCKEWTCPVQHDEGFPEQQSTPSRGGAGGGGSGTKECKKETTPWSSCSVTCGMGVSVRVTNDNADCIPDQQRRLCLVRPCELNDRHLKGRHCKNTWRADNAYKYEYEGCTSMKEFRPKYCSTCKRNRCCSPDSTKTLQVEFECIDARIKTFDIMWIKSCACDSYCL